MTLSALLQHLTLLVSSRSCLWAAAASLLRAFRAALCLLFSSSNSSTRLRAASAAQGNQGKGLSNSSVIRYDRTTREKSTGTQCSEVVQPGRRACAAVSLATNALLVAICE